MSEVIGLETVLASLLTGEGELHAATPSDVLAQMAEEALRFDAPIAHAIALAGRVDRLGLAFTAAYAAATRALVERSSVASQASRGRASIISLAATEDAGAHPRAIATRLEDGGNALRLRGSKRWTTLALEATDLLVIARHGEHADGRPWLRAALVEVASPGLTISAMPETPFCPEIRHAELHLDGVLVPRTALVEGDAYTTILKPFRTVEDIYVQAGLLAWLLGASTRCGGDAGLRGELTAAIAAVAAIERLDPSSPSTHVALDASIRRSNALLASVEELVPLPEAFRARLARDRPLLEIASRARAARLAAAWRALDERPHPPKVS